MSKPTETSKKVEFLEKIAKISKFLKQTANFWREMQKFQGFN